jgi:Putative abortive phage resistance protein AbiGi, antitoxin
MSRQRYISPELSHFVGGNLNDAEAQYDVLITILRSGELRARHFGGSTIFATPLFPERPGRYEQAPICFCDIPEPDLAIHIEKYGPFGLAFTKEFLTGHGARPVFYVSTEAIWGTGGYTVADQINDLVASLGRVQSAIGGGTLIVKPAPLHQDLVNALNFLIDDECLKYVKGFNPSAGDNDEENYYMEREWRTTRDTVAFTLADVRRVFMPESFGPRFRADVPGYVNQVSFVSDRSPEAQVQLEKDLKVPPPPKPSGVPEPISPPTIL